MILTLAGDDNPRLSARLAAVLAEHLPPGTAEFNLLELEGAAVTVSELRSAADALPFLGDTRVVLVRGLLRRFTDKDAEDADGKGANAALLKELKAYLPLVPPSTVLIFVERQKLGASAAANALKAGGAVEEFLLPKAEELPGYVAAIARERGAAIERPAATLLAQAVGESAQRIEPEIEKLIAYRGGSGAITERDVRELVDIPIEVAVWDLTDALFAHDANKSLRALRALLDRGQAPQQVLGAIASQVRNIVVAEEYRSSGPDRLATATGMKPFSARKALVAVRNFQPGEPRRLLEALLQLDLRAKTGKAEIHSALEYLVVAACAQRL